MVREQLGLFLYAFAVGEVLSLVHVRRMRNREHEMPAEMFRVIATFTDENGAPLTGGDYSVTVMDDDKYFDDKLGSKPLSPDGTAEFLITVADILSIDSAGERTPDLYFVVKKGGEEVFRSEVFAEVDFDAKDPVTGRAKGLTKAFGPFVVSY